MSSSTGRVGAASRPVGLGLALLFTLTACGGEGEDRADASPAAEDISSDGAVVESVDASEGPGDAGDARIPSHATWTEHIEPLIQSRCGLCHGARPLYGAPIPLASYEDMMKRNRYGQPLHEVAVFRVLERTMPPAGQPQLTDDEKRTLRAWSESGAPEGPRPDADLGTADGGEGAPEGDGGPVADEGADAGEADGGVGLPWRDGGASPSPGPGRRVIDLFAHAATDRAAPYLVSRNGLGASYVCFSFTIPSNPSGAAESAVHFQPYLDDIEHVHHLFVYHDPRAEDPDGPFECLINDSRGRIIGSWFPGRGATDLPMGTGVPVAPGQRFTLEVHYDNVPAGGSRDMSGMAVTLTEERGLTPAGEVWAGVSWEGTLTGPGPVTVQATKVSAFDDVTLFTATPHMHARGMHIALEYARAAAPNTWISLIDQTWDVGNQVLHPIEPPLRIGRGDRLRTRCTFSTAAGGIRQGASASQEMCYVFLYHYRPQLLPLSAFVGPAE